MNSASSSKTNWSIQEIIISSIGLAILVVGFSIAIQLVTTVWGLFSDQSLIQELTSQVEQHSHLNSVIERLVKPFAPEVFGTETVDPGQASIDSETLPSSQIQSLNISYFVAWILAVLLLGLVGHVAALTLSTGARLLHAGKPSPPTTTKEDMKEIIQQLAEEIARNSQRLAQQEREIN